MTSLLLILSCADSAPSMAKNEQEESRFFDAERDEGAMGGAAPGAPAAEMAPAPVQAAKAARGLKSLGYDAAPADGKEAPPPPPEPPGGGESAPTRAWFPESFLWSPMVEVPASGTVTVDIPVPDTLTTWRVLALGQTRTGAQAGTITTFASTLPAYLDMVTPTFLYTGDVVSLPLLAVSQLGEPLSASLSVTADGASIGGGGVSLAAYGSRAETVSLTARKAGPMTLHATLGELDAVEKIVPVRPVGRPVEQARGGTLAGPRTLTMSATPGAADASIVVNVFAGTLGVVRGELDSAPRRAWSLDDAAYTYAVTGMAAPLVEEGALEAAALRRVQLETWQDIARATRNPGVPEMTSALVGVRMAPADTLAGRLAVRLAEQLRAAQAPDGMWTLGSGAQLDGTLVQSARAVWALGADNQANRLRATGAFERFEARLVSPYVAAWGLAADVVDEASKEKHRKTIRDALTTTPDGAKLLQVDARRPDGSAVTRAEATALAILALPKDDPAVPDLAAGLLAQYTPGGGFGDGWTGLLALQALQAVFTGEVPREVTVRVSIDDAEVARGVLDTKHPHAPVRLTAPGLSGTGEHRVTVTSDPPVPGLAFTLVARDYAPWTQAPAAGLELSVSRPALAVGQRADLYIQASAPAGMPLDVSLGLPAGVEPDRAALDTMVRNGAIGSWRAEDGRVTLQRVATTGGAWGGIVPVTPTLAGALLADAARVWPSDTPEQVYTRVPERWVIR